jgi:hypothetical protein
VAPRAVKTSDIYWGAVPFVVIQLIMVALIIIFPGLVSTSTTKAQDRSVTRDLNVDFGTPAPATPAAPAAPGAPGAPPASGGQLELPAAPAESEPTTPQFEFEKK